MGQGTHFRLLCIVFLMATVWPGGVRGQTLSCLDRSHAAATNAKKIKIIVESVEFPNDDQLTEAQRALIAAEIQKQTLRIAPNEPADSWGSNLEVGRDALQDQAYFKACLEWTPNLIKAEANERHYAVSARVDLGSQYRLGTVRFENAKLFGAEALRRAIPLQEGDRFAAAKIRAGLDAIRKLYGSKCYLDAIPGPEFFIEAEYNRVDLLLRLDEGKQFQIGSVEGFGLNSRQEGMLRNVLAPGRVFDWPLLYKFLEEDKSFPQIEPASEPGIQLRRDPEIAKVNLILDFRSCPPIPTSAN